MPRNQFQRMFFAFLTVVITVHAYVFYSLYVVNGNLLMEITGADSVIQAINTQGGVYMFGTMLPIWAVVLIEFCFAYSLECLLGSPLSFKMASKMFDPMRNHPMIFETVIISCTVLIMCPAMSFTDVIHSFYRSSCAALHRIRIVFHAEKHDSRPGRIEFLVSF